jgi:peptide/nickel transport system permease protein
VSYAARLALPRLVLSLATLVAVSLMIFWGSALLPGDTATRILGRDATPQSVAALRQQLHLNEPVWRRYGIWLGDFVQGNWGQSLVARRPVTDYVVPRLENSLTLAGFALAIYIPLSLVLGITTAILRGRRSGALISALVIVGTAIPEFVVGLLLLLVFALKLPWFPPLALIDQTHGFVDLIHALALPAITLAAAITAYAVRMMQGSLVPVLESDYVRLATLKGLPRHRVILRHALPNALGPAIRVTVLNIAFVIGGIVPVEVVYNFPGIGQLLVDSIRLLDIPVIEAIAMILAAIYILANLGADLLTGALNPRLRAAAAAR